MFGGTGMAEHPGAHGILAKPFPPNNCCPPCAARWSEIESWFSAQQHTLNR
jgi:hypothetical protein